MSQSQSLTHSQVTFITFLLRKSPNCGITSKNRIAATPTNVHDHTYIFLHVYNSNFKQPFNWNCYQEPDWLFKIRIVNMQKYVGAVVDLCGSGGDFHSSVTFVIYAK